MDEMVTRETHGCEVCGFALQVFDPEPGVAYCPGAGTVECFQMGYERQHSLAAGREQKLQALMEIVAQWNWLAEQKVSAAIGRSAYIEHRSSCPAPAHLTPIGKRPCVCGVDDLVLAARNIIG